MITNMKRVAKSGRIVCGVGTLGDNTIDGRSGL
jgi:hypothetical protein